MSIKQEINKVWSILYNKILIHVIMWMNLKNIMLYKGSHLLKTCIEL